jgi:peptidase E
MPARTPTILATSMGFNRARDPWRPGPIFSYAFDLVGSPARPKLCVITTATGDRQATIDGFSTAFAGTAVDVSHLMFFEEPNVPDVAGHLHEQDVIWVDRGSVVNLLAVWQAHTFGEILHDCWQAGVVLGGESAGSLCWFTGTFTETYSGINGTADGLGFLPFSNSVHYGEDDRRERFHQLVGDGTWPKGHATDTGAGLHYEGTKLVAAVADRPHAGAYLVERSSDGAVKETPLDIIRLKRDKGA